jgi:hypothetical protein
MKFDEQKEIKTIINSLKRDDMVEITMKNDYQDSGRVIYVKDDSVFIDTSAVMYRISPAEAPMRLIKEIKILKRADDKRSSNWGPC